MDRSLLPPGGPRLPGTPSTLGDSGPARELTLDELEAQLLQRKSSMMARLEQLQDEVMTTGDALREAVARKPIALVGGAVAAGLVVGLLFGKRKRKDRWEGAGAHRALVDRYLSAVVSDVRRRVDRGKNADEAVEEALKDRVPVIVVSGAGEGRRGRGIFSEFMMLALNTGLGFAMKALSDYLQTRLDLVTVEEEMTVEETPEGGGPGAKTTMTRRVSESSPS